MKAHSPPLFIVATTVSSVLIYYSRAVLAIESKDSGECSIVAAAGDVPRLNNEDAAAVAAALRLRDYLYMEDDDSDDDDDEEEEDEEEEDSVIAVTRNLNPKLAPWWGLIVGYNDENVSTFCCLGNDDDADEEKDDEGYYYGHQCYHDDTVHSILMTFDLSQYGYRESEEINDYEAELTPGDIPTLVPGMWLQCKRHLHDDDYHSAMFLTSTSTAAAAAARAGATTDGNGNGRGNETEDETTTIRVEYYHELDMRLPRKKEWVPVSWCNRDDVRPKRCGQDWNGSGRRDDDDDDEAPSPAAKGKMSDCEYLAEVEEALMRRAFNGLAEIDMKSGEVTSRGGDCVHNAKDGICNEEETNSDGGRGTTRKKRVLFSYVHYETLVETKDGDLEIGHDDNNPFPVVEVDPSSYDVIYSHLNFAHPVVQDLDNKFRLYQLYKADPRAASVFPVSYSSYGEALLDTKAEAERNEAKKEEGDGMSDDDENIIAFYVKTGGGSRGEGINILIRERLSAEYDKLKSSGYDVDRGRGDVIIQRAVTDLHTVDVGPIANRRYDIRFYILIARGSSYVHSNMLFRWSIGGPEYDPNDTKLEHQVVNVVAYGGGEVARLLLVEEASDWCGNGGGANGRVERRRRGSNDDSVSFGRNVDPHAWRDAVANALDDASGVFANAKELTKADPTKYVVIGGDAMIRENGLAVLVEFNVIPDMVVAYSKGLVACMNEEEGACRRMIIADDKVENEDSDIAGQGYQVTPPSILHGIVSSELTAEVLRDVASMVMNVQPTGEIKKFREIMHHVS